MDREQFRAQLDMLVFQARTEGLPRRRIAEELTRAAIRVLQEHLRAHGGKVDRLHDQPKH